ncbi:MAG: type II toxin-antitoxin system VapC family toxin [Microbacterium sp.]
MSYLLDSNVVSELRKNSSRIDPNVARWAESVSATQHFISVISLLEIELGVLRIERRDARAGEVLREWFDRAVLSAFARRTLPLSREVARTAARLHVPDPRPERDAYIAATALQHGLTVVTRNVSDFEPTGVSVLNPWAG